MLKKTLAALVLGSALVGGQAFAADYAIDKQGQHAFVNFKISTSATAGYGARSRISMAASATMRTSRKRARLTSR